MIVIAINLVLQSMFRRVLQQNQAAMVAITNFMTSMSWLLQDKRPFRLDDRPVWRLERNMDFFYSLMNAHHEKEFIQRLRVRCTTFVYICSLVAPDMQKSNKGGGIPLEIRVAAALNRLGMGTTSWHVQTFLELVKGLPALLCENFARQ